MQYWIMIDDVRHGPLSLSEVGRMPLTPDTPVWHEGMPDWVTARELPELSILFAKPTPEIPAIPHPAAAEPAVPTVAEVCPPTYLGWNIAATILCCLPLGIVGIIFSSKVTGSYGRGDIAEARKWSERAGWCLILAITLGLLTLPMRFAIGLL